MNKILLELENRRYEDKKGGGKDRTVSQHNKGKLTARERMKFWSIQILLKSLICLSLQM